MLEQLLALLLKVGKPKRGKFYTWTLLEGLSSKIEKAVEAEINEFPNLVIEYVSTALPIPKKILRKLPWLSLMLLLVWIKQVNQPTKIPLLVTKSQEKNRPLSWDYSGREWHYWSHLLAKTYGWGLEEIKQLDVDVALAHIQEILTDEQLEREFLWSMSEIAYPYNPTTKQSKFSPLPRPYFMQMVAPEPKKVKMLKILAPVGEIRDASGFERYFQEKAQTQVN